MRIFWILVLVIAVFGGYYMWQHYWSPQSQADGAVHWEVGKPTPEQKAAFDKENSGETADGNSEHKNNTARGEAAAGNPGGLAAIGLAPVPAGNQIPPPAAPSGYPPPAPATPANVPMTDSQYPNAPNGVRFGGRTYQWYRQGDLTYRVDTTTGSSCIAFATMEEWRKPIVYSHGCGRGA